MYPPRLPLRRIPAAQTAMKYPTQNFAHGQMIRVSEKAAGATAVVGSPRQERENHEVLTLRELDHSDRNVGSGENKKE
jgi:hypothetical protein